jgi:hypothetical protein
MFKILLRTPATVELGIFSIEVWCTADCIDSPWMATLAVIIEPLVIMWSFLK